MTPFDEPPNEGDELPPGEEVSNAPTGLPRLSIAHLFVWTATTAAAFLPYQLWRAFEQGSGSSRVSVDVTIITEIVATIQGICSGTFLFIAAALLIWRRRGFAARLQPGHWLAVRGAIQWTSFTIAWLIISGAGVDARYGYVWLFQIPQFAVGLALFSLFLWLAVKAEEPARWRWAYAILAVAPALGVVLSVFLAFVLFSGGPTGFMVVRGLSAAMVAFVVLIAVVRDRTRRTERHWSHWIASVVYLIATGSGAAIYLAYAMFPQLMNVR